MLQLSQFSAKDVMRSGVETLSPEDTVETALALFEDAHIGGAPVVESTGRLVGVLTLSDIARPEHTSEGRIVAQRGDFEMGEPFGEELSGEDLDPEQVVSMKDDYSASSLGRELVGDWMTREVISVPPDASLVDVCALMVERQIHRVFVTRGGHLAGVISSFDVVRCVAREARPVVAKAHR